MGGLRVSSVKVVIAWRADGVDGIGERKEKKAENEQNWRNAEDEYFSSQVASRSNEKVGLGPYLSSTAPEVGGWFFH